MNCDQCNRLIGNTLYEIGTGERYRRLCPICWLGKEEGSKSKYQQFDYKWTISNLAAFKAKPWPKDKPEEAKDWIWNHKDGKWVRKT